MVHGAEKIKRKIVLSLPSSIIFFREGLVGPSVEHDHSVQGFATDLLAAIKYRRGEIGLQCYDNCLLARHQLQQVILRNVL